MALHKILLPDGVTELANVKSVTFKEAVNSGVDLRPGCVGSASIEVEVYGAQTNAVSVGDALTYYQIDKGGNQTLIGVFYAEPTIATKNSWKFVAYDAAQKLSADFSSWLMSHQASFPMTIYALVSAACTEAGVTLGSASWTLSTENVNAFYADGITCRQVLSYAAELGCKFVRCHSDGKVYFDWYAAVANKRIYPSAGTSGSEKRYAYKQDGLSYANYTTAGIDGVAVHPSGEDDVAYIYPTTPSGDNLLNITNNLLLTGADAALYNAAAQAVYTALNALGAYRPATARLFPMENPFRAGDVVAVTDVQGVSFTTVIMEQTITDSDATLTSTGNEYYADGESNPQKALVQLASDVVRIKKLNVDQAWVDQLFANDINATGSITGARLFGANVQTGNSLNGLFISGNNITYFYEDPPGSGQITNIDLLNYENLGLANFIVEPGTIRATDDVTINANLSVTGTTRTKGITAQDDVSVTGDISATGDLTVTGKETISGDIIRQLPTIALQTNYYGVKLVDENDDSRGGVFYYKSPTYGEGLRMLNSRYIGGSQVNNGLSMYVDDSGNRYVVVNDQSAWQKGLGTRYVAGDSIAFGTTGNDIYNRWVGDWRNTTNLWFTIPLTKPCDGLSATITGSVIVCSNGQRVQINITNVTATCYCTECGVTVNLAFSSAPSYAVQYQPVTVQSYGTTITFS